VTPKASVPQICTGFKAYIPFAFKGLQADPSRSPEVRPYVHPGSA